MPQTLDSKRIAKNTIVLYVRMMVIMCISLYSSRVVLTTLGVQDFGIYNVVGGFVAMFTLVTGSLSNAITRYVTFELGKNAQERLLQVFSNSIIVQVFLAFFVLLMAETVGIWFLNNKMQIPSDRMIAANWVFQCSVFTFIVNLINVPYNACIIAHEKMKAYAYISILEAFLKLAVIMLLFFNIGDKLIFYAIALLLISVFIRIVYGIYCRKSFKECHFVLNINKQLIREMTSMAGWNILGTGGGVLANHGVNILINMYFGVIYNAARGIAVQVDNAVNQFVNSFTTAMNPQLTKLYAIGDMANMFKLLFRGSRFSFYLMFIVACPLVVSTPTILKLWLNVVPEYTVLFVRLTLIASLLFTLTSQFFVVAMATGNIKEYQIIIGGIGLSSFFIIYLVYIFGGKVETAYYVFIFIRVIIIFARLYILKKLVNLNVLDYIKEVLIKVLNVTIITVLILYLVTISDSGSLIIFIANSVISIMTSLMLIYLIGLEKEERTFVVEKVKNVIKKH